MYEEPGPRFHLSLKELVLLKTGCILLEYNTFGVNVHQRDIKMLQLFDQWKCSQYCYSSLRILECKLRKVKCVAFIQIDFQRRWSRIRSFHRRKFSYLPCYSSSNLSLLKVAEFAKHRSSNDGLFASKVKGNPMAEHGIMAEG